jgi:thiamine pyrophosphate-dependent acetolactate synthase large subunit-like protein
VRLAESLGARGARARTAEELEKALAEALDAQATTLIDAVIPPDAVSSTMQRLGAVARRLRPR